MYPRARSPIVLLHGVLRSRTRRPILLVGLLAPSMLSACLGVRSEVTFPGPPTPAPETVRTLSAAAVTPTSAAVATSAAHATASGPESADNGHTSAPREVEAAVALLAADLGIAPEDVTVTSVEATNWNNSALGCPQADMFYLQVITPGYIVVLEVDGQQAVLHTDRANPPNVVRCDPDVGLVAPTSASRYEFAG